MSVENIFMAVVIGCVFTVGYCYIFSIVRDNQSLNEERFKNLDKKLDKKCEKFKVDIFLLQNPSGTKIQMEIEVEQWYDINSIPYIIKKIPVIYYANNESESVEKVQIYDTKYTHYKSKYTQNSTIIKFKSEDGFDTFIFAKDSKFIKIDDDVSIDQYWVKIPKIEEYKMN